MLEHVTRRLGLDSNLRKQFASSCAVCPLPKFRDPVADRLPCRSRGAGRGGGSSCTCAADCSTDVPEIGFQDRMDIPDPQDGEAGAQLYSQRSP